MSALTLTKKDFWPLRYAEMWRLYSGPLQLWSFEDVFLPGGDLQNSPEEFTVLRLQLVLAGQMLPYQRRFGMSVLALH